MDTVRGRTATVLTFAMAASAAALVRDAGACSCVGPQLRLIAPDRLDDAPRNAHVRLAMPAQPQKNGSHIVLRAHGSRAEVATTSRSRQYGMVTDVELVPNALLAADTQYELATIDPTAHPPETVFGTFRTGSSSDTTAPRLDSTGHAAAKVNPHPSGGSCGIPGPWVVLEHIRATDPGRADAQLAMAVWLGDASGRIDDTRPPSAIEKLAGEGILLGPASMCDPRSFPFPKTRSMWIGLAVLDEAGNRSATKRVRVDLAGATP
jgi:hypothetical protein